jgi:hypothetical protein
MTVYYEVWGIDIQNTDAGKELFYKFPVGNETEEEVKTFAERVLANDLNITCGEVRRVEQ